MSGYKRVNFYELCRLCATSQQKNKTHIFNEEGRKIQLQTKIQSCLSLNVCENDCLPKVVCSKCLRTLEVCYIFRQECTTSETMLATYFKNFRYTEDFKSSGKVYIKDTTNPTAPSVVVKTEHTTSPSAHTQLINHQPIKFETTDKLNTTTPPTNQFVKSTTSIPNPKFDPNTISGEIINISAQIIDLETLLGGGGGGGKPPGNESSVENKQIYQLKIPEKSNPMYGELNTGQQIVNFVNSYPILQSSKTTVPNPTLSGPDEASTVNLNVFEGNLSEKKLMKNIDTTTTTKTFFCEMCLKAFKRREHLYQHLNLHTGYRPFSCEVCTKSFMRKEHLLRHKMSHSGQKNYSCSICEKTFSRNDNLLKHRKTHERQAIYTCEICRKEFVMKHYYLAHKNTHHMQPVITTTTTNNNNNSTTNNNNNNSSNNNNMNLVWTR